MVGGSTVRVKHVGRDIMAGPKNVVVGELTSYTELLSDACGEAARLFRFAADQGDVFAQYNTFA